MYTFGMVSDSGGSIGFCEESDKQNKAFHSPLLPFPLPILFLTFSFPPFPPCRKMTENPHVGL